MNRLFPFLLALFIVAGPSPTLAKEDPIGDALDGLSGTAMLEMVKELADDKMLGRKTGWKGGPMIEEWVAAQFANFGLHPADRAGAYLEPYKFASTNVKAPIACTVAGTKLEYGKDYSHLSYSGSAKVEAPVVFCGYGIDRPDLGYDDYKGVDVKGKVVIAIRGLPDTADSGLGVERFIGYKSSAAADKGAVGFLLVENEKPLTGTIQAQYYRAKVPGLWLSHAAVDKLLAPTGKKIAALKKAYDDGKGAGSFETGSTAALEVQSEFKKAALGHNVLARIDGRDPDLKKEIVLIGAHCDHLGVDPTGKVFNGADDNASGTAVLVHLADILSMNKFRPKRTVVFCAFTGEEQGLHGSMALATNSPFHGNVVAVLNMDMVGQGDPVVSCAGVGSYPRIGNRLRAAIPDSMKASVHFAPRAGGGSDHWPFYDRGIPAFAISTRGKHPNYHTPLDDAANIQARNLEVTAQVVGRWLVTLAAHEEPLHDAHALARFVVDDAPRIGDSRMAVTDDTTGLPAIYIGDAPGKDLEGFMARFDQFAAEFKRSVRITNSAGFAKVRSSGRMPVVFRADAGKRLRHTPSDAATLVELGYRILRVVVDDPTLKQRYEAVIKACKAAGAIVDLTGMENAGIQSLKANLANHPSMCVVPAGKPLPDPVPGMVILQLFDRGPEAGITLSERRDVVVYRPIRSTEPLVQALVESGIDLSPGSDGRKRARAWLGESFVRLLGR